MTDLLFGVDIGTSNVKAVLATPEGTVVAQAQSAYETQFPQSGWAEQHPQDWWQGTVSAVQQALSQPNIHPSQVKGIGVSGQGCAVTLLDTAGEVIRPAIIWMDARSEAQCETLRQCCADDILQLNGKSPAPYNADPVLMWLRQHEPQTIDNAQTSLTTTGYITWRLSGEQVMNVSDASILFAFDLSKDDWSDSLIDGFGLPRRLYPRVTACQDVIGELQPEPANALGLPAGIPVIAGGEDTSSAGLAIGVAKPGQALLSLGTAGTLYVVQDAPNVHPDLLAFAHVLKGQVLLGGSMVAVGGGLNWYRQIVGDDMNFADMTALAEQSEPGANRLLFLPYLSGELQPINDGYARGVFFGLNMGTTQADMVRAVMEGSAFAIAHNATIASEAGTRITEIRAVGGPTRSKLWCQIIADISGYPVTVLNDNAGAPLGDALLAGAGVGLIDDLAMSAIRASGEAHIYEPRAEYSERYQQLFAIYHGLYPQLARSFSALDAIE